MWCVALVERCLISAVGSFILFNRGLLFQIFEKWAEPRIRVCFSFCSDQLKNEANVCSDVF